MKFFLFSLLLFVSVVFGQSSDWVVGYRYMPYDRVVYLGITYEAVVLNTSTNNTNASTGRPNTATTGWRIYNPQVSGSPAGGLSDAGILSSILKITEVNGFTVMVASGFVILGVMWRVTRG